MINISVFSKKFFAIIGTVLNRTFTFDKNLHKPSLNCSIFFCFIYISRPFILINLIILYISMKGMI